MKPVSTLIATALVGGALASGSAHAFPDETVELIVPFSAGGGTDIVARAFEPGLSEALGERVIIRNVDGASGTVGAAEAARARPDGHTVGFLPIGPVTTQPHLRSVPYDMDSWEPVCLVTNNPVLLLVSEDSEFQSVDDVKAAVADNQSRFTYGSSGPGTIPHIAMVAASDALGMDARHIPYDGTAGAMAAMAGGEIQFFADTPAVLQQHNVRALAVFAPERLEALPDVPTMKELGHEMNFSVWRGMFAPAGTPSAAVDALADGCRQASESASFQEMAEESNSQVQYLGPDAFETFVRDAYETNEGILEAAGLTGN